MFRPLNELKDNPCFKNLNWFTYFRLKILLEESKKQNPGLSLMSTGVTLPSDKTGKTSLYYIPCVSEAYKQVKKGFQLLQENITHLETKRHSLVRKQDVEKVWINS